MEADEIKDCDRRVSQAIATLSEHFDAIQILASRVDENGKTACCVVGAGNLHARVNMAREYVMDNDARVMKHATQDED